MEGVSALEDYLNEFRVKYGSEAADEAESRFANPLRTMAIHIKGLDESLRALLGSFKSSEMISAAEFLRAPFKDTEARLRNQGKILLLYKSAPSAAIFDVKLLEEIQEGLDAVRAVVAREITEGSWVSSDDFWKAVHETRPK